MVSVSRLSFDRSRSSLSSTGAQRGEVPSLRARRGDLFQRIKPALLWALGRSRSELAALLCRRRSALAGLFGWLEGEAMYAVPSGFLLLLPCRLSTSGHFGSSASEESTMSWGGPVDPRPCSCLTSARAVPCR